jgi:hypothetical protein
LLSGNGITFSIQAMEMIIKMLNGKKTQSGKALPIWKKNYWNQKIISKNNLINNFTTIVFLVLCWKQKKSA